VIRNNWGNAVRPGPNRPGMGNWLDNHPNRRDYWNSWGGGVRSSWRHNNIHRNWFGPSWWVGHPHAWGGWHFHRWNTWHNPGFWWRVPVWTSFATWFTWRQPPPQVVWAQPVFFDYGTNGNVVVNNDMVFINGQPIATPAEFAESAAVLATVPPPANDEEAAVAEWMPLGTFAISTDRDDTDASWSIQLAVTRTGIIGGTLYNADTDEATAIQGQVDPETQRVAFRLGTTDDLVIETGLYNLTQSEVPVMAHFGTETTENWLLIRLDPPAEEQAN
jgi:hypothetical protein